MAFHFNPSLWFVCKLCRETFPDTDKFKAHKLQSHLGEILNIQCIVFEEKLLDNEWAPPSPEYISKHDQLLKQGCASEINDESDGTDKNTPLKEIIGQNQKQTKFTNPYVSLKRLTFQEPNCATSSSSAEKIGTAGTRSKVRLNCDNFGTTDTNGNIFSKQKKHLASEVSSFSSKLPIKTDNYHPDDVHKNKIRELLSNAVIIKSEPNNDTDNRVFLEPQDLPISIVSAYSLSPSSYSTNLAADLSNTPVAVPGAVPGITPVKMEFIDSDLITNQNLAIISAKEQPQQLEFDVKPDLRGCLELASNSCESAQFAQAQNTLIGKICNTSFENKYFLASDYTDSAFKCSDCDITFSTKCNLRGHLIARHGQTTPFKCQNCGKCFITRARLQIHEATHTGYRPFKCHFQGCASEFASQNYLHCHRRSVHGKDLGLPQFACSTCGKSFGLRKNLNTHLRTVHKT